jgi:hypothetical protein
MAKRINNTAAVSRASKRNIARAQMSRRGIKEPRSVGRAMRKRLRYSRPASSRILRTR